MKLKVFRGAGAFQRARESAGDHRVCGTYVGNDPVYFLVGEDASDIDVQAAAFRIREGHDMGEGERVFAAAMKRHMARS